MALVKQLQDAIKNAKAAGDPDDARQYLNQIITSNLPGTIGLAKEYADALMKEGLLKKKPIELVGVGHLSESHIRTLMSQAQDGMVIVGIGDKPEQQDLMVENLSGALGMNRTIIALAGTPENVRDFLRVHRIIAMQMPAPVKILTPDEEAQARKDHIVAQWREMRDFDVTVGHETTAPTKATFVKRPHKIT